jgi:hypothetical protein
VRDSYVNREHPPASTLVVVKQLFRKELLIEVDAVAVVKDWNTSRRFRPSLSAGIDIKFFMGGIGPIFDCEWPPKSLQDLFHPTKVMSDPEFPPLDLRSLKPTESSEAQKGNALSEKELDPT